MHILCGNRVQCRGQLKRQDISIFNTVIVDGDLQLLTGAVEGPRKLPWCTQLHIEYFVWPLSRMDKGMLLGVVFLEVPKISENTAKIQEKNQTELID